MINSYDSYDAANPRINGILWQLLTNNTGLRRPWETLGASKTLLQWIAVDDIAFVDNPWLPTYNQKLDIQDLANQPYADEIILGTAGYFSEVVSRASIPKMADLAAKFATLPWPKEVTGFYFPVEIDPTWTTAKQDLGPYWSQLPRPLYVSAYYGAGIDGEVAAQWLADLLPPDVNLMFQDGVGAFGFPLSLAKERLAQLQNHLGKERVHVIAEVFKPNPDWDGTPGEYFIPVTEPEYKERVAAYQDFQRENKLWVFDGPNYIKNDLIDQLVDRPTLPIPSGLTCTYDKYGDLRLQATTASSDIPTTTNFNIYDPSGNTAIRKILTDPSVGYGLYTRDAYKADYGFKPESVVMDAQTWRNPKYFTDKATQIIAPVVDGPDRSTAVIVKNSWGDIYVELTSKEEFPWAFEFYLDLFHPNDESQVFRTITVQQQMVDAEKVKFFYENEISVQDYVDIFNFPGGFDFLRFRIRQKNIAAGTPEDLVGYYESNIPVDNAKFVKKTAIMGINSLIGGYFNDLSDPLNPGGTGNPGRKDVVAASTFRTVLAEKLGLHRAEVMPVMTVVGSSPINPMPYQAGFPLDNYWWNPTTNQPGPNLILADDIVKNLGVKPDYFIESGPGETTGIWFASQAARPGILAAWKTSNIAMLDWMRTNWGNTDLNIWFQGATTSWWGLAPPPTEINAEGASLLRQTQEEMALNTPGFFMGSYVPDAHKYTTYRNETAENIGWVHYTVAGYHAAAREMATSIGTNTNAALNPPSWATLRSPTNVTASKQANGDIIFSWTNRPGFDNFHFVNKRADNHSPFNSGYLTTNSYNFTAAAQRAQYGYTVSYVVFEVAEAIPSESLIGPATLKEGNV